MVWQSGKKQDRQNNIKMHALDVEDPERNLGDLQETLRLYRDSVRADAERPAFYWKKQHNAVMAHINKPLIAKFKALLWAPAAMMVFLFLFIFVENSKAPSPDFAAGSDQILLIEVEQALNRRCPEALAPAVLPIKEIEQPN